MSNESQIALLWNCAKALKGEQQAHKLLRSYYINTCRKLARNNLQVPKEKFGLSQMCPHCGSFWNESEFEVKSLPNHLKLSSKEKKLIESYQKNDGSGKSLTRAQKNRAKWLMKYRFKRLVIKCQQCQHKSFLNIESEKSKSQTYEPKDAKSAALLNKSQTSMQSEFNEKQERSQPCIQAKSKKKKFAEKPKISICNSKSKANKNSSSKPISNTQNKNSLLQLAALLKKQTSADTKSSSQKKLQSLLK